MSELLSNGRSIDLPMPAGRSLRIARALGTFSARIVSGAASLPVVLATNATANATYGPYAYGVVVRLSVSAPGQVEYDVAATPALGPGADGGSIVVSADAPSNDDGRPENTIYIQV